uniref:Ig-like domain-containing protein n=1 Tax=Amazona collaria TaxID=241587 RepID=A0A8B9FLD8_9PSIT
HGHGGHQGHCGYSGSTCAPLSPHPIAGIPVAKVFPSQPVALDKPNTLVCLVENIFPPAVDITWREDDVPVTHGVTHTHYTPTGDVSFARFSYLRVTPSAGTTYSCVVTSRGLNSSTVAYWGERGANKRGPWTLWTALCGAAMALGIVLALMGITMMVAAWRSRRGG